MTDIVERLRDWSKRKGEDFWAQDDSAVLWEAADEIERLRAAPAEVEMGPPAEYERIARAALGEDMT